MLGERYSLDDAKNEHVCPVAVEAWEKDYYDDYNEFAQVHQLEAAERATQGVPGLAGGAALAGFNKAS